MAIQAPKGTRDMIPGDSHAWRRLEQILVNSANIAGYREIRTPVFEHTELFLRGVGDTTDIVQKEMYTFQDKGGRSITLKPEGTAGVVRAFIESGLAYEAMPQKLYYTDCPVFRYDKPQAGRYRQHHQFGVEAFGSPSPMIEADIISVAIESFNAMGLGGLSVSINSIGCPVCRPAYQELLRAYFKPRLAGMCETCKGRFDKNPMRIIDCKEEGCREIAASAPRTLDSLCPECAGHFKSVLAHLDSLGYRYEVDPGIVRGLDYYTRTVFEFIAEIDGKPMALGGGGRYDLLVETIGGPKLPGAGWGMGMERLLIAARDFEGFKEPPPVQAFIAAADDESREAAYSIAHSLRKSGVRCDSDYMQRGLKAQLKYCGKAGIPIVIVIGGNELAAGEVNVRDMASGTETRAPISRLADAIKEALKHG